MATSRQYQDGIAGRIWREQSPYLNPRWVSIHRISSQPLQPGCVIEYKLLWGLASFCIEQQPATRENLVVYRVNGGFADGGMFCFEVEPMAADRCLLTIYLVFDYVRGSTLLSRLFWAAFRRLFPEFIHDVLWNHALCEFKQVAEVRDEVSWEVHI